MAVVGLTEEVSIYERPEILLRDVKLFPGSPPKALHNQGHRGWDQRKEKEFRQHFSIQDPEAGITYHAGYNWGTPGPNEPRHRHPYAQIRLILSGEFEYVRKLYGPGWLGYFSEGIYYGPQSQTKSGGIIASQFPGRPGFPFNAKADTRRGEKLVAEAGGIFTNGYCVFPDGRKIEGFQALVEALYGQPADQWYPKPRYQDVVWMNTENYPWTPSAIPGVSFKHMGYFNDNAAIQLIQLEPGASTPPGTADRLIIRWIYDGGVEYDGTPLTAEPDQFVSNIAYPPGSAYRGLHTRKGAKVLSLELKMPPGQVPFVI